MLIYLLRHADAEFDAPSDAQRKLTPSGLHQGVRVGRFCKRQELEPAHILSSPLDRAQQTAFLVRKELGDSPVEVEVAPFLASGMRPQTALEELRSYNAFSSIMLVGHEPDLGDLAAHFLGATSRCIHIRKASLTLIETSTLRSGAGMLHFSIPAELM